MKLKKGKIEDLKEYTGYSVQFIHMVLNEERSQTSKGAKKILKAIEIMEKGHEDIEGRIKKALDEIDKLYKS